MGVLFYVCSGRNFKRELLFRCSKTYCAVATSENFQRRGCAARNTGGATSLPHPKIPREKLRKLPVLRLDPCREAGPVFGAFALLPGYFAISPAYHRSRVFRGLVAARSFSMVRRSTLSRTASFKCRSSPPPASKRLESPTAFLPRLSFPLEHPHKCSHKQCRFCSLWQGRWGSNPRPLP
jgi:hypothetical protein